MENGSHLTTWRKPRVDCQRDVRSMPTSTTPYVLMFELSRY